MELHEEDFKRLSALDTDLNATMRETDFVRRLLPHLIPHPDTGLRDMSIYVAAAGNPYRMIDVVADRNPNQVLFTVPPLLGPTPATIRGLDASPHTDIGELSAQFEAQMGTAHPGAVIDAFVKKLVALNVVPTEAVEWAYARMWMHIYDRYDIPLERLYGDQAVHLRKAFGGAPSPSATPSRQDLFDEIDDDDLEPI